MKLVGLVMLASALLPLAGSAPSEPSVDDTEWGNVLHELDAAWLAGEQSACVAVVLSCTVVCPAGFDMLVNKIGSGGASLDCYGAASGAWTTGADCGYASYGLCPKTAAAPSEHSVGTCSDQGSGSGEAVCHVTCTPYCSTEEAGRWRDHWMARLAE